MYLIIHNYWELSSDWDVLLPSWPKELPDWANTDSILDKLTEIKINNADKIITLISNFKKWTPWKIVKYSLGFTLNNIPIESLIDFCYKN